MGKLSFSRYIMYVFNFHYIRKSDDTKVQNNTKHDGMLCMNYKVQYNFALYSYLSGSFTIILSVLL